MKATLIILLAALLTSCTYSTNRYWEVRQDPESLTQNALSLSKLIKGEFKFIHNWDMPPRKGTFYLCGIDEPLFVILTVQDGVVVVSDMFKDGKYMSEEGSEFLEFIEKLKALMERNGAQVVISDPVRHFGFHWE